MFVIFATPFFSPNIMDTIQAFIRLPGIRLGVISQEPQEVLSADVRSGFAAHWRVQDALNAEQLTWAASELSKRNGPIHRLIAANEQIQLPLAVVRDRLGIPGMSAETVRNFRDKGRMKDLFLAAGVPCARHCRAESDDQAWAFVQEVGFPICVKPVDGAAAQSTYRVESSRSLRELLQSRPATALAPLQLEEFLVGQEHSFETISLGGTSVWHSWTRYIPTPLDVMRNPWIQWRMVVPREVDDAMYDDIKEVAERALDVLGMVNGFSHMEWFRRKDGSIAIGEVGCRPPGSQIFTSMNWANDFDLYVEWTRLMLFDEFQAPRERKYAVGTAFLRGLGGGYVKSVHGLEYVRQQLGDMLIEWKEPEAGQSAGITYEGEGYLMVRHPETAAVEEALELIVNNVKVELSR